MSDDRQRQRALDTMRETVARSGQHSCCGFGGTSRCFASAVGVGESVGVEHILPGAIFPLRDDVALISRNLRAQLKTSRDRELVEIAGAGWFTLGKVHGRE